MGLKIYDVACPDCGHFHEDMFEKYDEEWRGECPECESKELKMCYPAPGIRADMTSRTRLDGHIPQSIKDLKRGVQLEAEAASMHHNNRGEIRKEIKALKGRSDI